MTKKAAKKKEVGKKTAAKSSRARTESAEGAEEAKSSPEGASEAAAEKPAQEIKVVEEKAPREISDPPRKMGRVPRPDGGKRPERTESSRQQRSGSPRRSGGRRGGGSGGGGGSHRPTVDSDELGRKAWKVFQHEIAEEGLALIDETSARQLAEKSLVVTRAFLEERERRLGKSNSSEERSPEPLASEEAPATEETAPAALAAPDQEKPAAEASTPAAEA